MKTDPRFVALVPARGGSKRVPGKNVRPIAGRPLIAWTIAAALESERLERVVVSTEDPEIAAVSRQYGAAVPFLRPAELATDSASSAGVVLHAIDFFEREEGVRYDYLVLLQPTSPLRSGADIDGAIALLLEKGSDSVVSVCETDHPPQWSNTLPPDLSLRGFIRPELCATRSQELPTHYRLNGAIYVYDCRRALRQGNLAMDDDCYAYVMPRERSIDIDTPLDFEIAEYLLRRPR